MFYLLGMTAAVWEFLFGVLHHPSANSLQDYCDFFYPILFQTFLSQWLLLQLNPIANFTITYQAVLGLFSDEHYRSWAFSWIQSLTSAVTKGQETCSLRASPKRVEYGWTNRVKCIKTAWI